MLQSNRPSLAGKSHIQLGTNFNLIAVAACYLLNRGNTALTAEFRKVHQFVTFYRVDPSAASGKGDWVIAKQQDFGPVP